MKRIFSAIFALTMCLTSYGQGTVEFYVAPDGSDSADGSAANPFKTPSLAISRLKEAMLSHPGTEGKLLLKGGEYLLEDEIVFDGENISAPITISSADGAEVCLRGDRPVTGWKKYKGSIYRANLASCGIKDLGAPVGADNRIDLYRSGKRQVLARWPDKGFIKAEKALGQTVIPSPSWVDHKGTVEGIISYCEDRVNRWSKEKDPYAFGYFYWDWAECVNHIADVDPRHKVITFDKPYSLYGYRNGCRFYGFNLMCELDSPGEYYIDRSNGMIYWYAPEGVNPAKEDFTVSVYNKEYMVSIRNANGAGIKGINLRGGRQGAVSITAGQGNTISDCIMSCFGNVAVRITEGRGHSIDRCTLQELGYGGIVATGGDRKTLEPSGMSVTNTVVEHFSLFKRTYEPAINFTGAGMYIAHNRFEDSSSSALRLEGNDVTVEYNQFFNLVNESDDQGGVDVYYDYSYRRLVFRYNHFRDITGGETLCGAAGIRFDDLISGHIVYGNVFENCGGTQFGAVQIHGGKDNWVTNNVFYNCLYAISCTTWPLEHWKNQFKGQLDKCEKVDCFGPLYRLRYPELNQPVNENLNRNYSVDNLVVNVKQLYRNGGSLCESGNTHIEASDKPLSYYLNPSVLETYGLKEIPFDKIGVEEQ